MTSRPLNTVLQQLRAAGERDGAGSTDGELLTRFLNQRDDDALAALVERHAPMVWGVCHRVLRNPHDAEDAFQATFLVLVRKATAIQSRDLVANWLYGVAHQTAVRLKATAAKRGVREMQLKDMPEPAAVEAWVSDLLPLLDQELSRLPEHHRVLIVLCDLEGKTRKEAARQLGCPEGTVASRLARARDMLAKRMTRHGLAVSGGPLAAALAQSAALATVPSTVVSSTIKVATLLAANQAVGAVSGPVAALTEGVLKTMLLKKIMTATMVVLALSVAVITGGSLAIGQTEGKVKPMVGKEVEPPATEKPMEPAAKQEKGASSAWSEPFFGLQIRMTAENGVRFQHGRTLPLRVEMQNVSDAAVPLSDLQAYCHFEVKDENGDWLGIASRDISITPWERAAGALEPKAVLRWTVNIERLRLNKPASGKSIQVRIGIPRQLEEPGKLPRTMYSPAITLELADKPLTVGTNRLEEVTKAATETWSPEMDVVYRETGGLKGKSRAIHIDGRGRITLLDCGSVGRTTTTLTPERLNTLAATLKRTEFWTGEKSSPPLPDLPFSDFCVAYGAETFVGQFVRDKAAAVYQRFQAEMQAVIDEAVKDAKPPVEEKEPFTAWGKQVGGLQAGLGFKAGDKRAYTHGETVTLVVRVRNVDTNPLAATTLDRSDKYIPAFFFDWPPTVTDSEGKAVTPVRVAGKGGDYNQKELTLAPLKEVELVEVKLELRPESVSGNNSLNTLYGTGKFQIHYKQLMYASGKFAISSILQSLATGKLELEVKEPEKLSAADPASVPRDAARAGGQIALWRDGHPIAVSLGAKVTTTTLSTGFEGKPGNLRIGPDGKELIYIRNRITLRSTDPDKQDRVYVRHGKETQEIKVDFCHCHAFWGADGLVYGYGLAPPKKGVDPTKDYVDLSKDLVNWSFDPRTGKANVLKLPGNVSMLDRSPDGNAFLVLQYEGIRGAEYRLGHLASDGGNFVPLTKLGESMPSDLRFSPDGRFVLGRMYRSVGQTMGLATELVVFDLKSKARTVVAVPKDTYVCGSCWSPDGKRIAYVWESEAAHNERSNRFGPVNPQQEKKAVYTVTTANPDGSDAKDVFTEAEYNYGSIDWARALDTREADPATDDGMLTAWGKEVGGLQAGLGFKAGEKRAYHHGETVTLVVRVRNVGKETVKFEYVPQFLDETRPAVTDAEGKTVRKPGFVMLGIHVPTEVALEPGKEVVLRSRMGAASGLPYKLLPVADEAKAANIPGPFYVGTGKISLQYERVLGNSSSGFIKLDPALSKLATGKLELEVKETPAEKPKVLTPEEAIKIAGDIKLAKEFNENKPAVEFIVQFVTKSILIQTAGDKKDAGWVHGHSPDDVCLGMLVYPMKAADPGIKNHTRFVAILTAKTINQFKNAGIDDLEKHFKGKTIRVTGSIARRDYRGRGSVPEVEIVIDDLSHIEVVK